MNDIPIGTDENGEQVVLTAKMRQSTHMHVVGGSGKGKSKFLESIIRQDTKAGHGFCLVDWHGTLYKDVLRYFAQLEVGLPGDYRKVILINPSSPDFVTGFNPFMNQGADIATQVSRRIDATIRPWGITDTNEMPSFERLCRLLYTFAVEQQETLPNAAQLLSFDNKSLRTYAARVIQDPYIRQQWEQLDHMSNFRDWSHFALSTENRLSRFLTSKTIKRFMGLKDRNIDLREAMDNGHIVLVNLGSSQYLDRESARVFASLFLNEFFETAMLRAQAAPRGEKPQTFSLYLDEFQEYITDDIAAMLDQVRKGGLHMVLAHQHLAHLADNQHLLASLLVNARIRAVFGGLTYDEATILANEMFLPNINSRQIKKAYYHTIHLFEEQTRTIKSRGTTSGWSTGSSTSDGESFGSGSSSSQGTGHGSGISQTLPIVDGVPGTDYSSIVESQNLNEFSSAGESSFQGSSHSESEFFGESFSESESETVVPVFVPIPTQELTTEAEWSREEKASRVAEMLKYQLEQHCFLKIDTEETQTLKVPFIDEGAVSDDLLTEYQEELYSVQGARSGQEVDVLLEQSEAKFLMDANFTHTSDTNSAKSSTKTTSGRRSIFDKLKDNNPDLDI